MAFIDEKKKEVNCKVVYFGPPLCGKSTSLRQIYANVKDNKRGELVSLSTGDDRTLYFDFIPLTIGQVNGFQLRLHVYTVPGEVAYDGARKLIAKGVDGVVFMADSQLEKMELNLNAMMELKEMLEADGIDWDTFPMVIQYNKRDLANAVPIEEMRQLLNTRSVPDFETIATRGAGVFDALKVISATVFKGLQKA